VMHPCKAPIEHSTGIAEPFHLCRWPLSIGR